MTDNESRIDRFVTLDSGIKIRYRKSAVAGPPMVLVHGIGACLEAWNEVIAPLSRNYCVYTLDLPGHGLSDKPRRDYPLEFLAQSVRNFIVSLGVEKPVLVGWSLGGATVLRYLLTYGADSATSAILVCSGALGRELARPLRLMSLPLVGELMQRPTHAGIRQYYAGLFYDSSRITNEMVAETCRLFRSFRSGHSFLSTLRSNIDFGGQRRSVIRPILEFLPRIDIPTLIIWGRQDTVIPVQHGTDAAGRIPGAHLKIIDACGHAPPMEKPEEFCAQVNTFLSAHTRGS